MISRRVYEVCWIKLLGEILGLTSLISTFLKRPIALLKNMHYSTFPLWVAADCPTVVKQSFSWLTSSPASSKTSVLRHGATKNLPAKRIVVGNTKRAGCWVAAIAKMKIPNRISGRKCARRSPLEEPLVGDHSRWRWRRHLRAALNMTKSWLP